MRSGHAFVNDMEGAIGGFAMAAHVAIQQGIAVGHAAKHDADTYSSVLRLAAAFKQERRRNVALTEALSRERAARKLAEIKLWRQQSGH